MSTSEGTLMLWDWITGDILWDFALPQPAGRVTVNPSGTRFAFVANDILQE